MDRTQDATNEFLLTALRREGAAFRAAVSEADLTAPVPSCPKWTLHDLVAHVGGIYVWVRQIVESAGDKPARPQGNPTNDDLLPWFDDAFAALLVRLDGTDPEAPAWNWAMRPRLAGFWPRRMAHETAVHRWDAQMAVTTAEPVDPDLAVDGVCEVFDTWLPSGRGTAKVDITGVVRLDAVDRDHTWLLRLRAGAVTLLDESAVMDDSAAAQSRISGSTSDLLLGLYGRLTPTALTIEGDPAGFAALQVG